MTDLRAAIARLQGWFVNDALPLWAARGYDHARGGFYETLDFEGAPVTGQPRRVRVQARQIYTFTQAALRGWRDDGETLAAEGFGYFIDKACPEDGKRGCVHLISDDGEILDDRRDLYDQAFLLLACAARIKAGDDRAFPLLNSTMEFLDAELASPYGGWLESDRRETPRRQNPHMHLFEAFLMLYETTEDNIYLRYADNIYQLFLTYFYDVERAVLREFFNEKFDLTSGRKGDLVEPGHMMEWVWLLDRYARSAGENPESVMETFYARAGVIGVDATGFLVDNLALGRDETAGARRLWPQTEYVKAALIMARRGRKTAEADADSMIARMFDTYLRQPVAGLWCDRYLVSGDPAAEDVPASILYHLFEAAAEAADYEKAMDA